MKRLVMKKLAAGLGVLATILFGTAGSSFAGPSMSNGVKDITLNQAQCLQRGAGVMQGAGFTENFETVGSSVYGEMGDYTALIRCVGANAIVVFVVSGPDVSTCSKHQKTLNDRF